MWNFVGVMALLVAAYITVFWIFDLPINMSGIRHREWRRNKPTWRDTERWVRY